MGLPKSTDDRVAFLLSVISHFKDVLGEKATMSLLHYAASEAAMEHGARTPSDGPHALAALEAMLGAKVHIAVTTPDRLMATADLGPVLEESPDAATAEAILVGAIQGIYRRSAGRFPEVVLSLSKAREKGDLSVGR